MAIIKNYSQWLNEDAQAAANPAASGGGKKDPSGYGPLQYAVNQKIGQNDSMGKPFVSKEKPQTLMMLSSTEGGNTLRFEMIALSPDPMAPIQRTFLDYKVVSPTALSPDKKTLVQLDGIQPPNNMTPALSTRYQNVIDIFTMIKGRESQPGEDWKNLTAKEYCDLLDQAQPGIVNALKAKVAALGPNDKPYSPEPSAEPNVQPVFAELKNYLNSLPAQPAAPQQGQPTPSVAAR